MMTKPKCKLVGTDANIVNLIGLASRALKDAGSWNLAREMTEKCFTCGSYDQALAIIMEYVEVH